MDDADEAPEVPTKQGGIEFGGEVRDISLYRGTATTTIRVWIHPDVPLKLLLSTTLNSFLAVLALALAKVAGRDVKLMVRRRGRPLKLVELGKRR